MLKNRIGMSYFHLGRIVFIVSSQVDCTFLIFLRNYEIFFIMFGIDQLACCRNISHYSSVDLHKWIN